MQVFRVCGVRQILYVFSLYHNSDLEDQTPDCLLTSMAAVVQAEDVRASFLFADNLNGNHQEWMAIIRSGWQSSGVDGHHQEWMAIIRSGWPSSGVVGHYSFWHSDLNQSHKLIPSNSLVTIT